MSRELIWNSVNEVRADGRFENNSVIDMNIKQWTDFINESRVNAFYRLDILYLGN